MVFNEAGYTYHSKRNAKKGRAGGVTSPQESLNAKVRMYHEIRAYVT